MPYEAFYNITDDFALFTAMKLDKGQQYFRWRYIEKLLFEIITLRSQVKQLKLELCLERLERERERMKYQASLVTLPAPLREHAAEIDQAMEKLL